MIVRDKAKSTIMVSLFINRLRLIQTQEDLTMNMEDPIGKSFGTISV
jgi:hypothetical protein